MEIPAFQPSVSDDMRATIEAELAALEKAHDVRILFAVESGSRAWGFPSPDSDYDVRFVYARRREWYLSIFPGRDVIERPIDAVLDIGGWDIKKALGLLLKPNPVMYEWLSSPIRYRWDEGACSALLEFSGKPAHNTACLYHYLSLGERQFDLHLTRTDAVKVKKYFYILRPALAIRWIRLRPNDVPPMNVQAMMVGLDLPDEITKIILDLIDRKANLEEGATIDRIGPLEDLFKDEFAWARSADKENVKHELTDEANALFRELVG